MDVLAATAETDGDVDSDIFRVQSRGKQKDFDDEKLEEIRHHITEILGDPNAVVMFESVADEQVHFGAAPWSKCPLGSAPACRPAPPQGAPGGPVQLGAPRVAPGHCDPSHGLSCSS